MKTAKKIKMALVYKGVSLSNLARTIGCSPQSLSQRLKTGKFSSEELEKIAQALGCTYTFYFEFPDGTKI